MRDSEIVIAHVRPLLLGTYGDVGNVAVLARRLAVRGIAVRRLDIEPPDVVPADADVIVIGGGEDEAQLVVADDVALARSVRRAASRGSTIFAVCAGFQLLGDGFDGPAGRLPGWGVLDCSSDRLRSRAVGEVIARSEHVVPGLLTGFENHLGRTTLGPSARPLAHVAVGVGNGTYGTEGGVAGGIYATYLHGPVLARNPALADVLLARAVGGPLAPIDPDLAVALHEERLAAGTPKWWSGAKRRRSSFRQRG